jgi:hypothetical protein
VSACARALGLGIKATVRVATQLCGDSAQAECFHRGYQAGSVNILPGDVVEIESSAVRGRVRAYRPGDRRDYDMIPNELIAPL